MGVGGFGEMGGDVIGCMVLWGYGGIGMVTSWRMSAALR